MGRENPSLLSRPPKMTLPSVCIVVAVVVNVVIVVVVSCIVIHVGKKNYQYLLLEYE